MVDPLAAPLDISRVVCADCKPQRLGTEISLGRFVSEYFTPLTFDIKTGVISVEDLVEIWETVKEAVMEKVRRNKSRSSGGDSIPIDEEEVKKSFWISRPDGWVVNRKMMENHPPRIQEDN